MYVEIEKSSGFCFGVVHAIEVAERELQDNDELYCIGDIVHNHKEVNRLNELGLRVIDHDKLDSLKGKKVLIRAHGEHPDTYIKAFSKGINLIDATCPVVLRLQNKIRKASEKMQEVNGQVVIFGKPNHPEVNGLLGQTLGNGIVISEMNDLEKVDFSRPVSLFVQTTKGIDQFHEVRDEIIRRMKEINPDNSPEITDSICRQMSNRVPELQSFVKDFDVIIFVSGKKSSNGNFLYKKCKEVNDNTWFVSEKEEISEEWFSNAERVGICGATSTPMWLMEEIASIIKAI